jgi:16S rRNA (cytosine967-C5)-methyltransferase
MQARAPVDLRVNTLKTNAAAATVVLARDGVVVTPQPLAPAALRVVENPRLVAASRAYSQGMVELQDVSSQLVAVLAGARPGSTVLDYCAGGGGKALALAAAMRGQGQLFAWDAQPRRMKDLPDRARRAGAEVRILQKSDLAGHRRCLRPGLRRCAVLRHRGLAAQARRQVAAGSGRRRPVHRASGRDPAGGRGHVRPGGLLVYATCSLLDRENRQRARAFLETHPGWKQVAERSLSPLDGGDGFYFVKFRAPKPG